ncbi:MAG TPA: aldehyde ferredoxin oxidoreductase family protein [Dissulfurispiraceae bacterium]|nr:aldehyde ferredoxin oxidoreductase family protein [Dissulfurispiraceae bacterium]
MHGYTGKCLKIDLSTGKICVTNTPEGLCADYLGGRGLGVGLMGDRITHTCESPEMPLIFSTGPLVGTDVPTSGRMSVVSRSPLTGTVTDSSVGGRFGTELKRAGFDLIEITGSADEWVMLEIDGSGAIVASAAGLAGMNIAELGGQISSEGSVAAIGRAGENGVLYSSIMIDGRYAAGRGGLGAVMGAKKLKAIRVRGDRPIPVADPDGLAQAREDIMRLLRASPAVFGEFGIAEFGTAALVDLIHARRMEPTDNFRRTYFPEATRYSGYQIQMRYRTEKTGCAGCPILCKKMGSRGEVIPEFESVSHFGALNGCPDLLTIVEANRICNDFGLDAISAAATIACYAEISGIRPTPPELLNMLIDIGNRQGVGLALSEGSFRYACSMGRPDLSMSVKGLELPAYDPRGAYGMALAYATSNRGGCHTRAYPVGCEILRKPVAVDRFTFEGKARMIKISEDINAVADSLSTCRFTFLAAGLEEYSRALYAVTGRDYDVRSLMNIGERIWNLERKMNAANGFTRADDDLPERFFTEEGSLGSVRIPPVDRSNFLRALDNYYRIRGYE